MLDTVYDRGATSLATSHAAIIRYQARTIFTCAICLVIGDGPWRFMISLLYSISTGMSSGCTDIPMHTEFV